MGWFEAAQGNNTQIAVTAERFAEEGFGGSDVARATLAHLSQLRGVWNAGRRSRSTWTSKGLYYRSDVVAIMIRPR
jgi:hypothetical protein